MASGRGHDGQGKEGFWTVNTIYQKTPYGIYAMDVIDGVLELRMVQEMPANMVQEMPAKPVKEKRPRRPRTTESDIEKRRAYYHQKLKHNPVFQQKQRDAAKRRRERLKNDPAFIAQRKRYAKEYVASGRGKEHYARIKNDPAFMSARLNDRKKYQASFLYARKLLSQRSNIDPALIPVELVEAKRLQLLIERRCREDRN